MKIVIEIPEYLYEHAKENTEDSRDEGIAMDAIRRGIPLPEHYGELVDKGDILHSINKPFTKC